LAAAFNLRNPEIENENGSRGKSAVAQALLLRSVFLMDMVHAMYLRPDVHPNMTHSTSAVEPISV